MENDRITCIKFEDHVEVAVKGDHQTVGTLLAIIMKNIIDNPGKITLDELALLAKEQGIKMEELQTIVTIRSSKYEQTRKHQTRRNDTEDLCGDQ